MIVEKLIVGIGVLIGNVIWVLLFGIWLVFGYLVSVVVMVVMIIGILLVLVNLKLILVLLVLLGKDIVGVNL